MNKTFDKNSIIYLIRDNLLKPMTKEIIESSNEKYDALQRDIRNNEQIIKEDITYIKQKADEIKNAQCDFLSELEAAAKMVKWND